MPTHVQDLNIDPATGVLRIDLREGLTVSAINVGGDHILPRPLDREGDHAEGRHAVLRGDARQRHREYQGALREVRPRGRQLRGRDRPGLGRRSRRGPRPSFTRSTLRGSARSRSPATTSPRHRDPSAVAPEAGHDHRATTAARRDYERLNNLGFFSKVELNTKPGPNPKKPADVTLDWNVTEQRTGTAQIGAGIPAASRGPVSTGTLRTRRTTSTARATAPRSTAARRPLELGTATLSIPYLGEHAESEKYSIGASIYTQSQTNYLPIYATNGALSTYRRSSARRARPAFRRRPRERSPSSSCPNNSPVGGVVSTSLARLDRREQRTSARRLSDLPDATGALRRRADRQRQCPCRRRYFVNGTQPGQDPRHAAEFDLRHDEYDQYAGRRARPRSRTFPTAPNYRLRGTTWVLDDTEDDVFDPRHGVKASLTRAAQPAPVRDRTSTSRSPTLDVAKFVPVPEERDDRLPRRARRHDAERSRPTTCSS